MPLFKVANMKTLRGGDREDLTGKTYGKLTIISISDRVSGRNSHRHWLCRCVCGKETEVTSYRLNTGLAKSCGCERLRRVKSTICCVCKIRPRGSHKSRCAECYNSWYSEWREKNKERLRQYVKDIYHKNIDRGRAYQRRHSLRLRLCALEKYGTVCQCCGEDTLEFLCIDHIDGGGNAHRKSIGRKGSIYQWLKTNNYPPGFQTLCHNCNMAKGFYGSCPHKNIESIEVKSNDNEFGRVAP